MAVKSDTTNNTLTYLYTRKKYTHTFSPSLFTHAIQYFDLVRECLKASLCATEGFRTFFYKEIGLNSKPTYFALSKACMYVD